MFYIKQSNEDLKTSLKTKLFITNYRLLVNNQMILIIDRLVKKKNIID